MTIHPVNQTNNQACNAWSSEGNTFAKFNLLDSITLSNLGMDNLLLLNNFSLSLFLRLIAFSIVTLLLLPWHIPILSLVITFSLSCSPLLPLSSSLLLPLPLPFRCWHFGSWSCRFGLFWFSRWDHFLHKFWCWYLPRYENVITSLLLLCILTLYYSPDPLCIILSPFWILHFNQFYPYIRH